MCGSLVHTVALSIFKVFIILNVNNSNIFIQQNIMCPIKNIRAPYTWKTSCCLVACYHLFVLNITHTQNLFKICVSSPKYSHGLHIPMLSNLNIFMHVLGPFFIAMMTCEKQLREKEGLWVLFAIPPPLLTV